MIIRLCALSFFGSTFLYADIESRDPIMDRRFGEFEKRLFAGDRNFPEQELKELTEYLRNQVKAEERLRRDGYAFVGALIELGDEATIRERVRTSGDVWRWKDFLILSGSPHAIEALIPILMADEPARHQFVGDVVDMSTSHQVAANLLPSIIKNCPKVKPEVRAWAERFLTEGPAWDEKSLDRYRTVTRDWWRENAQAFREHNYDAVKSGRLIAQVARPEIH